MASYININKILIQKALILSLETLEKYIGYVGLVLTYVPNKG